MYSLEEKKKIRQEFWDQFKVFSNKKRLSYGDPGKWIMNDTNIKQLKLKFHFDENIAFAGFEIETRNLDKRIELYDKIERLKAILESKIPGKLEWIIEAPVNKDKTVSRIIVVKNKVNIYNKTCWPEVKTFLFETMYPFEKVFLEYKDFLKY